MVAAFGSMMMMSSLMKNYWIFYGYIVAVRIRKTIISAMYTKVSKLSMKSLTSTNSGKLITIVSSDMQSIERPLAVVSTVLAAPLVNLTAYIVLGLTSGWVYSIITFAIWIVMLVL